MAIQTLRNPPALDSTLQSTNGLLSTQNGKLDSIVTAIMSISLASVGNVNSLTTTDKTSLVGAVNELNAGKVSTSSVGVAGGVAELDNTGKVPASQLPAFVDDVIEGYLYNGNFYEDSAHTQLITPEDGKLYVDLVGNRTYRWSGSQYTEVSQSLALGETSTTAYRGDRGKTAYDHSQDANRITTAKAEGLYKIGATAQGHISSATAVTKGDITALGLVGSVTDSTTNGNILVDDSEVQVYDDTDVTNDITDINGKLTTATTTSTGNPINFSTKTAQNAVSTIIDLEPIQDLHGYDKPWVGGAGANKWDEVWEMGAIRGADGTNVNSDTKFRSKNFIPVTPNSTVYFVHPSMSSSPDCSYFFYQSDYTYISYADSKNPQEVQIPNNCAYIRFSILGTSYGNNIAINYPSTVTTYSPYENLCPISGRTEIGIEGCGKNIIDSLEQGIYAIDGSTTESTTRVKSKIFKLTSGTYSISFSTSLSKTVNLIYTFWKNGTYGTNENIEQSTWLSTSPYTLTLTQDSYVSFTFRFSDNSTITSSDIDVQVEKGSATTYEPYTSSNSLTIQFGETVYGCSLDVEKGVLTVDKGYKTVGDLNWTYVSANAVFYSADITDEKKAEGKTIISSDYQTLDNVTSAAGVSQDASVCLYRGTDANHRVYIKDTRYTDASTFKTTMSSVQLVYELATPTTIQLTPHQISLLKGVNNISVSDDYSTITLTYRSGEVATLGDLLETENKMLAKQHVYSTDEHVIGTWVDGKPVYEKVVTNLSIAFNNNWITIPDLTPNGDTAISAIVIDSEKQSHPAGFSCDNGGYIYLPKSDLSDYSARSIKSLIIQYTKST